MHGIQLRLGGAQPLRIDVELLLVASQAVDRLLHLDARGLQRVEHIFQRGIVLNERIEPADDAVHLRETRRVALGEPVQRKLGAFEQARCVREAAVIGLKRLPRLRSEIQRLELFHLPSELFALRREGCGIRVECRAFFAALLPRTVELPHLRCRFQQPAIRIEQFALRRRTQKRLVFVLAVDVDEELTGLPQLRERHRGAVDEAARASAAVDDTPHETHIVAGGKALLVEPGAQRASVSQIELGADLGPLAALPHDCRVAPLAEHQCEGVDEDGLPRACFSGEDGETAVELELEMFDDDEVADGQSAQHLRAREMRHET